MCLKFIVFREIQKLNEEKVSLIDAEMLKQTLEETSFVNSDKITTTKPSFFQDQPVPNDFTSNNLPSNLDIRENFEHLDNLKLEYLDIITKLKNLPTSNIYTRYSHLFLNIDLNNEINTLIKLNVFFFIKQIFATSKLNISWTKFFSIYNLNFTTNLVYNYRYSRFLNTISLTNLYTFEKHFLLKINKFFLKKKKFKKLNILKKIKKVSLFKKLKKNFFSTYIRTIPFFNNSYKYQINILTRRIPISKRVVETTNIDFFYKLNKHSKNALISKNLDYFSTKFSNSNDFIIYLRNYHQKPYLKLRKARVAHWQLFFTKTIRKQRYKSFLLKYIRNYHKLSYVYSFLVNFFTLFKVSWFRLNKLESFSKTILIENSNFDIVKLPLLFSKILKWKFLKHKNLSGKKRISKWSYLNFKRATCPWLQQKKNSPKVSLHLQPNINYFNYLSYWDSMTGYLLLDESLAQSLLPISDQFKKNILLKLHMYRYKATN